jgi:hypothetical protein
MLFDPEELKLRAVERTGFNNFGPQPMDDGLRALCTSLREEGELNAFGLEEAEKDIVATLCERLRITDCLRQNPEILEEKLVPQIFVVGLPRTGTTALSQFLSEDPSARSVRRWEINCLTPPPDASIVGDPRLIATRKSYAIRRETRPDLNTILPVEAEDPAESGALLGLTFRNLDLISVYNIPSYAQWGMSQDLESGYRYFANTLQLMQWKTPGRHWNLKRPRDVLALDAIHAVFPEAIFVWTHRDPAKSIASLASLLTVMRRDRVDHIDKLELMRTNLEYQAESIRRGLSARERIGEQFFVDSSQDELARDIIGVIRTIYSEIGLPFTSVYEAHLKSRLANRPRGQHGTHKYNSSEYGITADEIRASFKEYLDRFDVLASPTASYL